MFTGEKFGIEYLNEQGTSVPRSSHDSLAEELGEFSAEHCLRDQNQGNQDEQDEHNLVYDSNGIPGYDHVERFCKYLIELSIIQDTTPNEQQYSNLLWYWDQLYDYDK